MSRRDDVRRPRGGGRALRIARSLIAGAVVALLPANAAAQAAGTAKLDFRALGEDGVPVVDLKPDEISLKVNGKARTVQSLSLFRASGETRGGGALPPAYATNAVGVNGRTIHILIDDDSISPGREAQVREAVRLIASEMGPADRIGVLTPQGQLNMRPGADPMKVRLAVDALTGRAPTGETESDAQCRTTRVLAALGSMLAITGGTPTTIVIFSGGMSPPKVKQIAIGSLNSAAATNDVCPILPDDFQNIGNLAGSARADLYLFHITEGMVNRSSTQDAGFESLAGVTGAEFTRLTGSVQPSIARLLRETSAYYVAGFEPDASDRSGQPMRVEMRATRDKVRLRARPSIQIPKGASKAPAPKDMLRSGASHYDLPLRAAAYASRNPAGDDVMVVALFEAIEADAGLAAASVGLFDEKGTLKKQWSAEKNDLAKRPVLAALTAPAGTYRMRVAAVDGAGRGGTADYELKAEVPRADPLKLSALVLGTQQQGGGFAPRLDFASEAIAIGMIEIYGVPKGGSVTVDLDVAQTAEGNALAVAQTTVSPGRAEDMRIAFGGFAIATLPPGDYLMRAVVSLDGKPVGKVVRTLRK
ncbi:MAG TPA: hypothetical protein VFK57_04020 [Vicinamibacterales bacterium]|nr:hypothetical protein [Vicinamibacterales bacterium]